MKIVYVRATTMLVSLDAPLRHANGACWGRVIRTIVEVICDNGVVSLPNIGLAVDSHQHHPTDEISVGGPFRYRNPSIALPKQGAQSSLSGGDLRARRLEHLAQSG